MSPTQYYKIQIIRRKGKGKKKGNSVGKSERRHCKAPNGLHTAPHREDSGGSRCLGDDCASIISSQQAPSQLAPDWTGPEREQTLHQPLPARTCKGTSEALFRLGRHFMLINRAMLRIGKKKELGPCMACRAAGVIFSDPSQSFPDQLPHNCIERAS